MRTVIIADLSQSQIDYLKNLANKQGIQVDIIVEGQPLAIEEKVVTQTPITGVMLDEISKRTGYSLTHVIGHISGQNVSTVEKLLNNNSIIEEMKDALREFIINDILPAEEDLYPQLGNPTTITQNMIYEISEVLDLSSKTVEDFLMNHSITTVEQALEHPNVPQAAKDYLRESYC